MIILKSQIKFYQQGSEPYFKCSIELDKKFNCYCSKEVEKSEMESNLKLSVLDKSGCKKQIDIEKIKNKTIYDVLDKIIDIMSDYEVDAGLENLLYRINEFNAEKYVDIYKCSRLDEYECCLDKESNLFFSIDVYQLDSNLIIKSLNLDISNYGMEDSINKYISKELNKRLRVQNIFKAKRDVLNNNINIFCNNAKITIGDLDNTTLVYSSKYSFSYLIGDNHTIWTLNDEVKEINFSENILGNSVLIIYDLGEDDKREVINYFRFRCYTICKNVIIGVTKYDDIKYLLKNS